MNRYPHTKNDDRAGGLNREAELTISEARWWWGIVGPLCALVGAAFIGHLFHLGGLSFFPRVPLGSTINVVVAFSIYAVAIPGPDRWRPLMTLGEGTAHAAYAGAIAGLIFANAAIEFLLGVPMEPFMRALVDIPHAWQLLVVLLVVPLAAPLGEELLFRGVVFSAFYAQRWRYGAAVATIGSASLFTVIHAANYSQLLTFVYLMATGVLLGMARATTGSLLFPMLLHAEANLLVTAVAFVQVRLGV